MLSVPSRTPFGAITIKAIFNWVPRVDCIAFALVRSVIGSISAVFSSPVFGGERGLISRISGWLSSLALWLVPKTGLTISSNQMQN